MIHWNDSLSTGVDNVDAQHKELIDNFNSLLAAIQQGKGREETGEILDFLQFYAQWHFEREEHYMEEYHCPAAQENLEAHSQFLTRFGELYDQYHQSNMDIGVMLETVKELGLWIADHIATIDSQLKYCVPEDK